MLNITFSQVLHVPYSASSVQVTSHSLSLLRASSQGQPPIHCDWIGPLRHSKYRLLRMCQQGHLLFTQHIFSGTASQRWCVDNGDDLRICFMPLKMVHDFQFYNLAGLISSGWVKESAANIVILTLILRNSYLFQFFFFYWRHWYCS